MIKGFLTRANQIARRVVHEQHGIVAPGHDHRQVMTLNRAAGRVFMRDILDPPDKGILAHLLHAQAHMAGAGCDVFLRGLRGLRAFLQTKQDTTGIGKIIRQDRRQRAFVCVNKVFLSRLVARGDLPIRRGNETGCDVAGDKFGHRIQRYIALSDGFSVQIPQPYGQNA